jgi:hypothetical protein
MKGKLNFIIDALMFLVMTAVAGLGFLMKYILIPGKDRVAKFGRQVDLYFLNLDRHEWGSLHLILGYILLALLVLHIVLHWQSILCLFQRLVRKKSWRIVLTVAFLLICLFLFLFPFNVKIRIEEVKPGKGHHAEIYSILPDSTVIYSGNKSDQEGSTFLWRNTQHGQRNPLSLSHSQRKSGRRTNLRRVDQPRRNGHPSTDFLNQTEKPTDDHASLRDRCTDPVPYHTDGSGCVKENLRE